MWVQCATIKVTILHFPGMFMRTLLQNCDHVRIYYNQRMLHDSDPDAAYQACVASFAGSMAEK